MCCLHNQNESVGQFFFLLRDSVIILGSLLSTCSRAISFSQVDKACMCRLSRFLGCISISVIVGCQGVAGLDSVMVCSPKVVPDLVVLPLTLSACFYYLLLTPFTDKQRFTVSEHLFEDCECEIMFSEVLLHSSLNEP